MRCVPPCGGRSTPRRPLPAGPCRRWRRRGTGGLRLPLRAFRPDGEEGMPREQRREASLVRRDEPGGAVRATGLTCTCVARVTSASGRPRWTWRHTGSFRRPSPTRCAMRAAALIDLALRDRLGEAGGRRPGHRRRRGADRQPRPGRRAARRRRRARTRREAPDAPPARAHAAGGGGQACRDRPSHRDGAPDPLRHPSAERRAPRRTRSSARVAAALYGNGPAAEVPATDAALPTLAAAGGVRAVVSRRDQKPCR